MFSNNFQWQWSVTLCHLFLSILSGLNIKGFSQPAPCPWAGPYRFYLPYHQIHLPKVCNFTILFRYIVHFRVRFYLPIWAGDSQILLALPQVLPAPPGRWAMLNVEPCIIHLSRTKARLCLCQGFVVRG